jgi:non-homologous end joining protein Ku
LPAGSRADTGEEVASDEIMKGYKVDTDTYIEITRTSWKTSRLRLAAGSRSLVT